jgi:integrase
MIGENPAKGVRKAITDVKLEQRLSLAEIGSLGAAMPKAVEESPVALAAIRFMLLTGFRSMEALMLERAWVHVASSCVRFLSAKSGTQLRAIGAHCANHDEGAILDCGCLAADVD